MLQLVDKSIVENCKCESVTESEALELINGEVMSQFIALMITEEGRGLAAPQVGIMKKFFVAKDFNMEPMFNCFYVSNGSKFQLQEACLTYGKDNFTKTKRFKSVIAKYDQIVDGKLVSFSKTLRGDDAVVFQHETDHLHGSTIFMK